jgi:hypothetical protein
VAYLCLVVVAEAAAAAAPAVGMPPKPSLGKAAVFCGTGAAVFVVAVAPLVEVPALGISRAALAAAACFLAFSSSSSLCLSYPNCLILSSSSRACRSAASKSTGFAFDAPRPNFDFFGAEDVEAEAPEVNLEAPSLDALAALDDVIVRGAAGAAVLVVAGDGVRPTVGGVPVLGVEGLDGFGVDGFDHEVKKSSSFSSFAGVAATVSMPST